MIPFVRAGIKLNVARKIMTNKNNRFLYNEKTRKDFASKYKVKINRKIEV